MRPGSRLYSALKLGVASSALLSTMAGFHSEGVIRVFSFIAGGSFAVSFLGLQSLMPRRADLSAPGPVDIRV